MWTRTEEDKGFGERYFVQKIAFGFTKKKNLRKENINWLEECSFPSFLSLDAHSHVDDYSGTLGGVRKVHISALVTSP